MPADTGSSYTGNGVRAGLCVRPPGRGEWSGRHLELFLQRFHQFPDRYDPSFPAGTRTNEGEAVLQPAFLCVHQGLGKDVLISSAVLIGVVMSNIKYLMGEAPPPELVNLIIDRAKAIEDMDEISRAFTHIDPMEESCCGGQPTSDESAMRALALRMASRAF